MGGHTEHVLRLILQYQTAQLGGVRIGDNDHLDAQGQGQMDAAGKAIGNKGGHDVHKGLAPVAQELVGLELLGNGVEVPVREHHALGGTSGAAGVDHDAGMVHGIHRVCCGALALTPGNKVLPVDDVGGVVILIRVLQLVAHGHRQGQRVGRRHHQNALHMGALGSLDTAVVGHVQADQQVRVHLSDVVVDALHAVPGVHQVQGGTDQVRSVESVDDLRGHDADHRGNVVPLQANGTEGGSGLFDVDKKIGIGDLAAKVLQSRLVQVLLVLLVQVLKSGAVRQGLANKAGVVILQPGLCDGCVNRLMCCSRHRIKPFLL